MLITKRNSEVGGLCCFSDIWLEGRFAKKALLPDSRSEEL